MAKACLLVSWGGVARFCDLLAKKDARAGLKLYPERNNAIEVQGIDVVLANLPKDLKNELAAENRLATRMMGRGLRRVETLAELRVWIDDIQGITQSFSSFVD